MKRWAVTTRTSAGRIEQRTVSATSKTEAIGMIRRILAADGQQHASIIGVRAA